MSANDVITRDIYEPSDPRVPVAPPPPPVPAERVTGSRLGSRGGRRLIPQDEKVGSNSINSMTNAGESVDIDSTITEKVTNVINDVNAQARVDPRLRIRDQFMNGGELKGYIAETSEEARIRRNLEELETNVLDNSKVLIKKINNENVILRQEASFTNEDDNNSSFDVAANKSGGMTLNNMTISRPGDKDSTAALGTAQQSINTTLNATNTANEIVNIKNYAFDIDNPLVELQPLTAENILKSEEELQKERLEKDRAISSEYMGIITNDVLQKQVIPTKPDLNKVTPVAPVVQQDPLKQESNDLQYFDSLHVEIMRREGSLQYSTYMNSCTSLGVQPNPRVISILENNGCVCGPVIDFNTDIVGELGFISLCKALVVSEFVFNQITVLNFQRNGLGNGSIQSLASSFSGAPALREVNISYNRFGHRAVPYLKNLIMNTPSLMKLDVRGCDLLTFYDRQYLYKILKSTGKDKIFLPEME